MGVNKEKQKIVKELIEKYNIDIEKLKQEQEKLAKKLEINESRNFDEVGFIGAIANSYYGNQIISAIAVFDEENEILDQNYFKDKLRFPYLSGFRAYRELPVMVEAFHKLSEKPEIVFINAHGIAHPRRLGLASHFSLSTGIPTIGITDKLLIGEVKENNIILNGKIVGKVFQSKKGAKPLYISPGNLISVETAFELTKKFLKEPHKLPEPLYIIKRFAKKTRKELLK